MKVLLLVIALTWSFAGGYRQGGESCTAIQVSSPEAAAIVMHEREMIKFGLEPDKHNYQLYEIDISEMTMKKILIPQIKFIRPDDVREGR